MKQLLLCLLLASPLRADLVAGPPPAQKILVITGSESLTQFTTFMTQSAAWQSCPADTSGTGFIAEMKIHNVTVQATVPAIGTLNGYDQIWDMRFSQANCTAACSDGITAAQVTEYESYIQGGGSLFLMGDNGGYPGRNNAIVTIAQAVDKNHAWGAGGVLTNNDAAKQVAQLNVAAATAAENYNTDYRNLAGNSSGYIATQFNGMVANAGAGYPVYTDVDTGDAVVTAFDCSTMDPTYKSGKLVIGLDWQMMGGGAQVGVCGPLTMGGTSTGNNEEFWENTVDFLVAGSSCVTPTFTRTVTPSFTRTNTPLITPTFTATLTRTPTVTATVTTSGTLSATPSVTLTRTATQTVSSSSTATLTRSSTSSVTATPTLSSTISPGPSATYTFTLTSTRTHSPTSTVTLTQSPTSTVTMTSTNTNTITPGPSPTFTLTRTPSSTSTPTRTVTSTSTVTSPSTPSCTSTYTGTPSQTMTATVTLTATPSFTQTRTATQSATRTDSPTSTLSRTVTSSRTVTPTPTQSFSFTVTPVLMPFEVAIGVYNSAGELVRTVYHGSSSVLPGEFQLSPGGLALGGSPLTIDLPGSLQNGQSLSWDGSNNGGQSIDSGTYYIKMETKDAFGKTTSTIQSVQVIDARPLQYLEIYNSSGERVRQIALPAGLPLIGLSAEHDVIALDESNSAQSGFKLQLRSATGSYPSDWDGKNDAGAFVSSGVYSIVLVSRQGAAETRVESKSVQVLRAAAENLADLARLEQNPAPATATHLVLRYDSSSGATAVAELFNLAGERIESAGDVNGSGRIRLPLGRLSSGIYLLHLEIKKGSQVLGLKTLKAAVLR